MKPNQVNIEDIVKYFMKKNEFTDLMLHRHRLMNDIADEKVLNERLRYGRELNVVEDAIKKLYGHREYGGGK